MLNWFNRSLLFLGSIFFLGSMVLAVANMILRPLGHSIPGAYELLGYGSAAFVALGLGYSGSEKVHISVDILFRLLPRGIGKWLEAFGFLISGAFFLFAVYGVGKLGIRYFRVNEVSETLQIPFYPVVFLVTLGFFLFGLNLLRSAIKAIK